MTSIAWIHRALCGEFYLRAGLNSPDVLGFKRMKKIKINLMETNPNPSDDEIRSYMNFDMLVENARMQSGRKRMRRLWIALSVAVTLVPVWLVIKDQQQKEVREQSAVIVRDSSDDEERNRSLDRRHLTPPSNALPGKSVESKASEVKENINEKIDLKQSDKGTKSANSAIAERSTPTEASRSAESSGTFSQETSASVVNDSYVQAEPLDGYTQLYAYFNEHLTYPPRALADSVEGIEVVSFIIDERGKPAQISITHSLGAHFDDEARRLIKEMPDWRPATLNGRPVASQLSVPLTFQLNRIKKP
jgi:TonB family protein